jgi:elongation factor P
MYSTNELRKGLHILHNDRPWMVVDLQHVSPGKGAAFVRTRIKNLETGQVIEVTYKVGEKVGAPELEFKQMQFLYTDGTTFTFMDNETYDQVTLTADELGDARYFIVENSEAKVTFFKNKAVSVDIDNFVVLEVTETQPNIKGDTSGGGGKPATMSTGLTITVPFHINVGDKLKIDTRSKNYVEKMK